MLSDVLQTIQQSQCDIKFQTILHRIKSQHIFKYSFDSIETLSKQPFLDTFAWGCYRLLICKIIYDHITSKNKTNSEGDKDYGTMLEKLYTFIKTTSTNIKQSYCRIMEFISDRKCENIEFLLFLVCFSTKNVLSILSQNFDVVRHYIMASLEKHSDQIASVAFYLINYEITGIYVAKNVYKNLKLKYYSKTYREIRSHRNIKSNMDMSNAFKFFVQSNLGSNRNVSHKHNRKQLAQIQIEKQINELRYKSMTNQQLQLINEIKGVFTERNTNLFSNFLAQNKQQNKIEKNKRKTVYESTASQKILPFTLFENKLQSIRTTRYKTVRNSQAFKERRSKCYELKTNKMVQCIQKNSKKKQKKQVTSSLKNKKHINNKSMNLLTASLKFLFTKNQKKPNTKQIQKLTVEDWKKKINGIQQTNIQKVGLQEYGEKKKHARILSQSNDKNQNIKYFSEFGKKAQAQMKTYGKQNYEQLRSGFCQFIDQREPNQIGIVKNIMNFPGKFNPEKARIVHPKEIKNEYQQFLKRMQETRDNFIDEDNFAFRLQKVLTGTNRF